MKALKAFAFIATLVIGCVAELLFIGIPDIPVMIHEHDYVAVLRPGMSRTQLVARARALYDPDAIEAGEDMPKASTYSVAFYRWTQFLVERGDQVTLTFSKDGTLITWTSRPVRLY